MMIKVVSLLTRKEGWTHEQFVKQWVEVHAPLARAVPGIRRYVQCHITGTRTRADISETELELDGIAELWYDDVEALQRSAATEEARRLYADGAVFIGRIKTFITEEREIVGLS
jgi:uncharacterized protein (TIGR02118 family)